MNRLCLAVFLFTLVVVVLGRGKTLKENLETLRKIDINTVLNNDRIIKNYIDCVLVDNFPCTKQGLALKDSWKDGLDHGCDDCNEEEQRKVKKIVKYLYTKKTDWYNALVEKLDQDHTYEKKYDAYIKELLADETL